MSEERMVVKKVVREIDRTLLFGDDEDEDYHIIATKDVKVEVGDDISYNPYGANFGFMNEDVQIIKKNQ